MQRICVYCGSSPGFDPGYMAMAQQLGQALVDRNYELVYGGAAVGLMGRVADTVMRAGGVVIGVIPKALAHKVSHQGLTQLHVVASMHARKTMMFDLADAFIALPGGCGTLEEVAELLLVAATPAEMLTQLQGYVALVVEKWVGTQPCIGVCGGNAV